MAHRKRQAKSRRPYLTTKEFLTITGITRKALRGYEANNICEPLYFENDDYFKYWALDQVNDLRLVQALRHGDMSLKDIASYAEEGDDSLLDAAYRQTVDDIRQTRRMLKAIVHRQRQLSDFAPVENLQGYYLRYLPARWMAVIPTNEQVPELLGSDEYVRLFGKLKDIAETVGWAQSLAFGMLLSLTVDARDASRYLFIELTSPPMPITTGRMIVDGGCYHVLDPEGDYPDCNGRLCFECARFGRKPSDQEERDWRKAAKVGRDNDHTIMVDELERPYRSSIWANYTQNMMADRSDGNKERKEQSEKSEEKAPGLREDRPGAPAPVIRPYLMPHKVRLPLGVTACALPAGVYLCRQYSESERASAFEHMLSLISDLPHREFTAADEDAAYNEIRKERENAPFPPREKGPFIEPFAAPRTVGDPAMAGWFRPLEDTDLSRIVLPTDMALAPERGFCLTSMRTPVECDTRGIRHEMQVLVDASDLM